MKVFDTNLKACPKCGSLASFNTYFGAYRCENKKCDWRDDTFNIERAKSIRNLPTQKEEYED